MVRKESWPNEKITVPLDYYIYELNESDIDDCIYYSIHLNATYPLNAENQIELAVRDWFGELKGVKDPTMKHGISITTSWLRVTVYFRHRSDAALFKLVFL